MDNLILIFHEQLTKNINTILYHLQKFPIIRKLILSKDFKMKHLKNILALCLFVFHLTASFFILQIISLL